VLWTPAKSAALYRGVCNRKEMSDARILQPWIEALEHEQARGAVSMPFGTARGRRLMR
jgi:hypothetical protein